MDEITVVLAGRTDRRPFQPAGEDSRKSAEQFDRAVVEAARELDEPRPRAPERRRPAEHTGREEGAARSEAGQPTPRDEPTDFADRTGAPPPAREAAGGAEREDGEAPPPAAAKTGEAEAAMPVPAQPAIPVPAIPVPGIAAGEAGLLQGAPPTAPAPAAASVAMPASALASPALPATGPEGLPAPAVPPAPVAGRQVAAGARAEGKEAPSPSGGRAGTGRAPAGAPPAGGTVPAVGNAAVPTEAGAGKAAMAGDALSARPGEAARPATLQPGATGALPFAQIVTEYASQRLATPAAGTAPQPGAAAQVAERLVHVVKSGQNAFVIDLSPAELGRVRVEAEIADDRVRLHVHAERPETIDLLRADLRVLERALGDAGLKLDQANLQLGGRGDDQPRGFAGAGDTSGDGRRGQGRGDQDLSGREAEAPAERVVASGDGLVDVIV